MMDKYGNDWPILIYYVLGCLINILFSIPKIKSVYRKKINASKYFEVVAYTIAYLTLILSSWIWTIYSIAFILIESKKKENK